MGKSMETVIISIDEVNRILDIKIPYAIRIEKLEKYKEKETEII